MSLIISQTNGEMGFFFFFFLNVSKSDNQDKKEEGPKLRQDNLAYLFNQVYVPSNFFVSF